MIARLLTWLGFRCTAETEPYPEKFIDNQWVVDMHDVNHWEIRQRQRLAKCAPNTGYGGCGSCQLPWWAVEGHSVQYQEDRAMFALCEKCWKQLGPNERLKHYRQLWDSWPQPKCDWNVVEDAILRETGWVMLPFKREGLADQER